MINRSLIRIKTIQILYSYLLTRSDFQLVAAPAPGESSRDRLFAYSVYLDLLTLLLKLSGVPLGAGSGLTIEPDAGLRKNPVGRSLRQDAAVSGVLSGGNKLDKFDTILPALLNQIQATAAYTDYKRKRKLAMTDHVQFWNTIFATTIRKSDVLERELRKDPNFTNAGYEGGMKMFLDTLASFDDTNASYLKARKDLDKSLSQAYSLYHALLMLPVHITELHRRRLDGAKNKYVPTAEDLNPNMRLADNLFVKALEENEELQAYLAENPDADPANWRDADLMISKLLDAILATEAYAAYCETPAGDYATDASFWRDMLRSVIFPSDELAETLETKSVYWNDDLPIMGTFVLKTIRRSYSAPGADEEAENGDLRQRGSLTLLPKFMNEADERFGMELFENVVDNREQYRAYIEGFIDTKQWDADRLAFMDIVILMTAIAELILYPSIPVPVTFNEYIEIANDYSTARSGQFINGILYSVLNKLNQEGIVNKK